MTTDARDHVLDLMRVVCVLLVVVGHLLMMGAAIRSGSGLQLDNVLINQAWFPPVTWVAQIMPLFFIIGGFAGYRAWNAATATGVTAAEFIRGRILRLARPAIPLFAFFTIGMVVLQFSGVDPVSIAQIGAGVSSPLWFLAAYSFSQAFLPGLAELHARSRVFPLLVLLGGAVAVEVARVLTGLEVIGIFNMIFVWLFLQQLGFWAADGWFDRRSTVEVALIAVCSYLLLFGLVEGGLYRANMLEDLNPPTLAMILLGIGEFALVTLFRPLLVRIERLRAVRRVVGVIGARLVTIYVWHVPVIALLVGLLLLTPFPMPEPGTAAWWWTRPAYFAATAAVLAVVSAVLGRFERAVPPRRAGERAAADWAVGLSTVLIVLPPFSLMLFGLNVWIAAGSTLALATAVGLQRMRPTVTIAPEMPVPLIRGL
jgi:fucose 4-O-acetylase-like acetyltransferase